MSKPPRLAVRAVLVHDNRLLLVNAWGGGDDLWCAPGGGVEPHASLPDNLHREIMEETGLEVAIGEVCLVNEFNDVARDYHQVDVYFRCTLRAGVLSDDWQDPEGIVTSRRWVTRAEMAKMQVKPDSLAAVAWEDADARTYDPLEPIVR
ncbi:NUDIX domain-containing protein [Loktanella sp. F6476L]|uniref:NUDIX domain-containing protein n=1 Tax=Loktanella sp. F6476L TaxID=2926405 RepID=UPI001FF5C52A|nr:NUDIX domain-containing protein [Loktanella sp. F6476L]MCK0119261.1 NUDIX domain-containing protein [Loktanella sp. F6476L]